MGQQPAGSLGEDDVARTASACVEKGATVNSTTTHELALTRLWYLVGDWEGSGKGPDLRCRVAVHCAWALDDHFLTHQLEIRDADSDKVLIAEHSYIYYDRDGACLVAEVFRHDGMVELATGRADMRGRLVLTTDRLSCVPKGNPIRRLRRTFWSMAASQWAFTVEMDTGEGWMPHLEGQLRRRE
jgi:hypothetical protein